MMPFPNKKYKIIYADPPWSYNDKKIGCHAGSEENYNTLSLEEIKNLPVKDISDKESMCFLWITNPILDYGFEVLKAWNFNYKTCLTWIKPRSSGGGLGFWFRGYTEHILLGVKNNTKSFRCSKNNYIIQDNKGHSNKPDSFRKLIEFATNNIKPRIELFSRTKIHGWYDVC